MTTVGSSAQAAWIPLLFLVGYFSFFLIALPLIAASLMNERLLACLSTGAAAAIVPVVLLDSLSLFSSSTVFSDEHLQGYGFLLLAGVVGGALFWFVSLVNDRPIYPTMAND